MAENITCQPSRLTKFFSWFILGAFSVFFAEVVSGSSMFPYFEAWGIFAIMPLYTLHILVLSYVVYNIGRPRFYTLFSAGIIFGMYEAYITKVLWSPPWGDPFILVGGIAAIETIVLVLWWHPFWAFMIPLFAGENLLSGSNEIVNGLPDRFKGLLNSNKAYLLLPLFAFIAGALQSGNSPSPVHSLLSGFSTTGFLILLIAVWRKITKGREYSLRQLLPSKKEFYVLFFLLIVLYVVTGIFLRPEALPGFGPQINIWLIYAVFFVLFYLHLKISRNTTLPGTISLTRSVPWKKLFFLALVFTLASATFTAAGIGLVIMIVMWICGIIVGILLLILSVKDLIAKVPP